MKRDLRRNLLLAVAFAAVTAGVIIAAAPRGGHGHDSPPAQVPKLHRPPKESQLAADYLGLSRSELRHRLLSGRTLTQIVHGIPGHSTHGLIEAMLGPRVEALEHSDLPRPAVRARVEVLRAKVVGEMTQKWRRGDVAIAAARIGLSEDHLRKRLKAGETLSQIASTRGVSRTALIEALLAGKAERIEAALRNGSITASQEHRVLGSLRARVSSETTRKLLQSR